MGKVMCGVQTLQRQSESREMRPGRAWDETGADSSRREEGASLGELALALALAGAVQSG